MRPTKRMCDEVLRGMSGHFDEIYAENGAPSIPPETLLKGKVLQALYTVRSERQLCDRLQTDLLFRRFVDLPLNAEVFDASTTARTSSGCSRTQSPTCSSLKSSSSGRRHGWISNEHFSMDATPIEAWASLKRLKPKGSDQGPGSGNAWTDFKGEKRSNATHKSTTDPEAKLMRKGPGKGGRLCFAGHAERAIRQKCESGCLQRKKSSLRFPSFGGRPIIVPPALQIGCGKTS